MPLELSVIIPIYNEVENIPTLFNRLNDVCSGLVSDYELIFVNDGSKDGSLALVKELADQHNCIKYIDFSRNFGHQIAVTAGLEKANGQAVVIIDADLQDPPELIIDMYQKMQTGYQVVYAKRKERKGESAFKKATASIFYRFLQKITSVDIPLDTGDFRIMDRSVVDVLNQMPEKNKFIRGQVAWIGFNQTYVEYERAERLAGETGYPLSKMLRFAMDGITAFSDWPLRLVTWCGYLVSIFAIIMIIYTLIAHYILNNTVKGWSSILISILFIGGIQMIAIGVIGEYLSRINTNIQNRPTYIIKESNL